VQKTGSPCSSLAFALRRHSEYLVGMADRSLKCFDTGWCLSFTWLVSLFGGVFLSMLT